MCTIQPKGPKNHAFGTTCLVSELQILVHKGSACGCCASCAALARSQENGHVLAERQPHQAFCKHPVRRRQGRFRTNFLTHQGHRSPSFAVHARKRCCPSALKHCVMASNTAACVPRGPTAFDIPLEFRVRLFCRLLGTRRVRKERSDPHPLHQSAPFISDTSNPFKEARDPIQGP